MSRFAIKRAKNARPCRASLYPSFALTGELGTSSDTLVRTLQNPIASLSVALVLPFVQWNTVRLNAAIAQSDLERTTLEFRQALYRALAEVEDALSGQAQLTAQAAQRDSALTEARLAAKLGLFLALGGGERSPAGP